VTAYIAFYCFNCNKIDFGFSHIKNCLVCNGEIKNIKDFNSEKEAERYCDFLNRGYNNFYSGNES